MSQEYLGDGLYVEDEGDHIRLYTQTGDEVYLDGHVLFSFLVFLQKNCGINFTRETPEALS